MSSGAAIGGGVVVVVVGRHGTHLLGVITAAHLLHELLGAVGDDGRTKRP
ncbi:hypothetical protein [Streptomyces sp. NPDC059909]